MELFVNTHKLPWPKDKLLDPALVYDMNNINDISDINDVNVTFFTADLVKKTPADLVFNFVNKPPRSKPK